MAVILHKLKRNLTIVLTLIWCLSLTRTAATGIRQSPPSQTQPCPHQAIIQRIFRTVARPLQDDNFVLTDGITIKRDRDYVILDREPESSDHSNSSCVDSLLDKVTRYANSHRLDVNLSKVFPMQRSADTGELPIYYFPMYPTHSHKVSCPVSDGTYSKFPYN